MKFFNTAGPNKSDIHYTIPPLTRWDLQEILFLIDSQKYFVLHAPRQTGKTSCMLALMQHLNQEGNYNALYVNVEAAQAARENVYKAVQGILSRTAECEKNYWNTNYLAQEREDILGKGEVDAITSAFSLLAKKSTKPVVLFIDEIDALVGDSLISVLRQIRAGYADRPTLFPQSIILCGVRDVRDYRIHSAQTQEIITGGSAFNIKAKSLRLGNFSKQDIEKLYLEHSKETGQSFAEGTVDLIWNYTGGQPWLVNALAYEVCFEDKEARDRSKPITLEMFQQAKEKLILRRDTHLDQLIDKLKEERVRRVIEPILKGEDATNQLKEEDTQYVFDLGLIGRKENKEIYLANEIYQEILPRELTSGWQSGLSYQNSWYTDKDTNRLDFAKLLKAFQDFFQENSEAWIDRFAYREVGPQLLLQAFLQRVVNGGGVIQREYGLGTKRTDLYIKWYPEKGNPVLTQKAVIECKLLHKTLEQTIEEGLAQVIAYADKCSAEESHLIIFDRSKDKTWDEKIFHKQIQSNNKVVTLWGM
ncbi:MAG: AAA-like domain-containing protein [Spirochaetota bacterium]